MRLENNSLHPQRPFQPLHRLPPQPRITGLSGTGRIGRNLPFAPDAQDAGMQQLDPPAAGPRAGHCCCCCCCCRADTRVVVRGLAARPQQCVPGIASDQRNDRGGRSAALGPGQRMTAFWITCSAVERETRVASGNSLAGTKRGTKQLGRRHRRKWRHRLRRPVMMRVLQPAEFAQVALRDPRCHSIRCHARNVHRRPSLRDPFSQRLAQCRRRR
jgi:hypothetical protein